jgi:transcriptional regulator with XRE-family HTH domain
MAALSERDRESVGLFVDEMKAAREQRGWSQAELGKRAGYSDSLIAMVEGFHRMPTPELAKALDRAFKTPGFSENPPGTPGTFGRLERRLRNLPFPAAFRSFAPYETEAAALRMFEHSLVPGLLQIPQYARAVLETKPNSSDDMIDGYVSARLARQAVLTREAPPAPLVYALVDEGALRRPVAPPAVMHDQLGHLVELSGQPNVTIQVVPYDARGHSGLLGAFVIADRPDAASIVFIEDVTGGRVSEDAATVAEVALHFDALRSEALPKRASRTFMESVAERWKEATPRTGVSPATAVTTAATA